MTKILVILIFALCVEAVGVVFLSKGLKQIGEVSSVTAREIGRIIAKGAANPSVLLGVALFLLEKEGWAKALFLRAYQRLRIAYDLIFAKLPKKKRAESQRPRAAIPG